MRDGLVEALRVPLDQRLQRTVIRVAVILLMVGSYVLAVLYKHDLVTLLLYAYGPIGQFAPVVFATLYSRRTTGWGAFAGLLAGSAVTIVLTVYPELKPYALHPGVYGLAINVLALVVVSALTQHQVTDRDRAFLEVAGREEAAGRADALPVR